MNSARLLLTLVGLFGVASADDAPALTVWGADSNDLCTVMRASGIAFERCDSAVEAVDRARPNGAVMFLAEGYPDSRTAIAPQVWEHAASKRVRVYVEFPESAPGVAFGSPQTTQWERVVTVGDAFGERLPALRILTANGCVFLPAESPKPWLAVARVAGYDTAVFGLPQTIHPILFEAPDGRCLVSATRLSGFVTGRFAPAADWKAVWETILSWLMQSPPPSLTWTPDVHPAYSERDVLPPDFERAAFDASAQWFHRSRLLIHESRLPAIRELLTKNAEAIAMQGAGEPVGDGRCGLLEGYASAIAWDGTQAQRTPVRADCNAEAAMTLAFDWAMNKSERSRAVATNLLDFVYSPEGMCGGGRGNPKHPAYGHVSWGLYSPLWEVANYGDDNARVILATAAASAALQTDRWDEPMLRALLANLRTTGTKGFRGDRIDMPLLELHGWRYYHDKPTVNVSPHFECSLWSCNLWAYRRTNYQPFLDRTEEAIRVTMEGYPEKWLWRNSAERSKMLLTLAWLVRAKDTPEHRAWLMRLADDVVALVQPCGAVVERADKPSDWSWSKTNEEYGTTEASLIQVNGDPASDQLYTTPFALLSLHEAYAATGDARIKAAEDKVAEYLCRIQSRSEKHPQFSGAWLRAFDFKRWDYWSASGDVGWGAWCIESGWGNAWSGAVLALRQQNVSLWDATLSSAIGKRLKAVQKQMAQNDGKPWQRH